MDVDSPSPKKCRRVNREGQQIVTRRRRRSLENLQEMPIDVLYEILSNLHPTDLLNLARTNKMWRKWIMSRSQRVLWRRSLRTIPGLPECPGDMAEPAYAFLMLKSDCHFCNKNHILSLESLCRVRCCVSCRKNGKNFARISLRSKEARRTAELLPGITNLSSLMWIPLAVWNEHLARKEAISGQPSHMHAALLDAYRQERLAIMETVRRTAAEISEWYLQSRIDRSNELARLRNEREEQVLARLKEMGWADELSKLDISDRIRLKETKAMNQCSPLTDRVWQKVQNEVLDVLRQVQEERIHRERSEAYVDLLEEHDWLLDAFARDMPYWGKSLPPKGEFWLHPEVQRLVHQGVQASSPSLAQDLARLIPTVVSEWGCMVTGALLELMAPLFEQLRLLNSDTSLVAIASEWGACMWWRCTECDSRTMDIPQVMHHSCLRSGVFEPVDTPQTPDDDLVNAVGDVYDYTKRLTADDVYSVIQVDQSACQRAVQIATVLCRPSITYPSLQEISALDPHLACLGCQAIMPWRYAVRHECADGGDPFAFELNLLDRTATSDAKALVVDRLPPALWSMHMPHYCTRCRTYDWEDYEDERIEGRIALKAHLLDVHGIIHEPIHGVDYIHRVGERYYTAWDSSESVVSFAEFVARYRYNPLRVPIAPCQRSTPGPLLDQVVDSETLSAMVDTHRDLIDARYL